MAELRPDTTTANEKKLSLYGYCPECGNRGVLRERRIDGNDTCLAGCVYPSKDAVMEKTDESRATED